MVLVGLNWLTKTFVGEYGNNCEGGCRLGCDAVWSGS
jgi:hypothetical protein